MHIHHVVTTQEVVVFLGMVAEFEMRDGTHIIGRVVATDYEAVHLIRTRHNKLMLIDIKQVVTPSPTGPI